MSIVPEPFRLKPLLYLNRRIRMFAQAPWKDGWRKFWLIFLVKPYTLIQYQRLSKLYDLMKEVEDNSIPGSIVECGAWEGGGGALLGGVSPSRTLWQFDSF